MDVYYRSFQNHVKTETLCAAHPWNASFSWGGYQWRVPFLYTCSVGMILDVCRQVPLAQLQPFYDKWMAVNESELSQEQREQAEIENPMDFSVGFEAAINGHKQSGGWSGQGWQPCLPEHNSAFAKASMDAYALSSQDGWYFYRVRFPWPEGRQPALGALSFCLSADCQTYPCQQHFTCLPGCSPFAVPFPHPVTGKVHTLRIASCQSDVVSLPDCAKSHPSHFCALQYGITPPLPKGENVMVQDCASGDTPGAGDGASACSVGLIWSKGGQESAKEDENTQSAISSLYFQPVSSVEWRISVQIPPCEPFSLSCPREVLSLVER